MLATKHTEYGQCQSVRKKADGLKTRNHLRCSAIQDYGQISYQLIGLLLILAIGFAMLPPTYNVRAAASPPVFEEIQVGTGGPTSVTTSANLTAANNHLYLASISTSPLRTVISVSGLGLTWTLVKAQCGGKAKTQTEVWKAIGAPAGDGAVTATISDNAVITIAVARYSGVDVADPIGNVVAANTNGVDGTCLTGTASDNWSIDLTTSDDNSLAFGAVGIKEASHSPGAGYTERTEVHYSALNQYAGLAIEDKVVGSSSTVAVNGTMSSAVDWAAIAVEIKGEAAGPTATPTATATATATPTATPTFTPTPYANLTMDNITFANTTLNGSLQTIDDNSLNNWQVESAYPAGTSWHVNISSTDLSDGAHTLVISNLEARLLDTNITIISGTDKPSSQMTSYTSLSTTAQTLLGYSGSDGKGNYQYSPDFRLNIPADTYAGSYTATVTTTFIVGP
jgi:hypothetical protein